MRLVALYFPGVTLVGNLAIGVVLLYGGSGHRPRHAGRDPGHVPAVPAAVLRAAAGRVAVLQHLPVGRGRPWRRSPAYSTRRRRCPSPPHPVDAPRAAEGFSSRPPDPSRSVTFAYRDAVVLPEIDLDYPRRAEGRAGRRDRRGQDHDRETAGQVLRPGAGPGAAGWRGPARRRRRGPAPRDRADHPGELPVQRDDRGEHRARQAGRDPGRDHRQRPWRSGRANSSLRCPRATTRRSASAAGGSRPASGS